MDVLLRTWRAIPWKRLADWLASPSAEFLSAGLLLGVLAVCGVTQFQAHWGSSGPMERSLIFTLALGLMAGLEVQRKSPARWPVWLMLSATSSLLLPWWMDQVAAGLFLLPAGFVVPGVSLEIVSLSLGAASLLIPALCWSATVCSACAADDLRWGYVGTGLSLGIFLTAMLLGPWMGIELATIVCAALALAISYRGWYGGVAKAVTHASEAGTSGRPLSLALSPETGARGQNINEFNVGTLTLIGLALFGCGGTLALSQNLSGQLMPPSVYIQQIAWAVIAAGIMSGMLIAGRWFPTTNRPAWAVLVIVIALAFNGFVFETSIHLSLWSAAFLINATIHQLALAGLVMVSLYPLSVAAGMLIGTPRARHVMLGVVGVLLGETCFRELALMQSPRELMIGLLCGLSGLSLFMFLTTRSWPHRRWQLATVVAGLACGGLSPWLQPKVDPALPAKLLFSTPTFLAYRAGWSTDLLPQMDDSRLIGTEAGRHGLLTVWKSRGSDLLMREAGIPRSAISCRPDLSPQLPSEVLQTVFPMLVAKDARSVLLLGGSAGIPLSTCLSFPVQQVRCVEPDAERIALIRGLIAAERGYDPFTDERVEIDRRSVELAAAMSDGGYDVILSSPPLSTTVAGASQFTKEFYQHVSRKLSEDGLFCQRLEAIDYGPLPFQLVVRGMQAAFRDVTAVEIGVGEYLLLATNSARGLAPGDLPLKLETPHVRRVLARCGWDWSTLLTLSAWDHAALKEIVAEGTSHANTAANCRLAFVGPREMLRWSPKLKEMHDLLTKPRSPSSETTAENEKIPLRRSRYLDWLGNEAASKDLLRRLSEVAAQTNIVLEGPDSFWVDYRKVLREELQQRPRTEIRQVAASDETERVLHPEDERRKNYFQALGAASDVETRSLDAVRELANYFEPYDPLISLFARQETAELLGLYGHPEPAAELAMRLYVIRFAPNGDRSLRNILSAADLLLRTPAAAPDPQERFDLMNDLLQIFRQRWEVRSNSQIKSVRLAIQDVDRSVVVIEKMMQQMEELLPSTQMTRGDWEIRKEVVNRVLLRPLRGYRSDLLPKYEENKLKTDTVIQQSQAKKK